MEASVREALSRRRYGAGRDQSLQGRGSLPTATRSDGLADPTDLLGLQLSFLHRLDGSGGIGKRAWPGLYQCLNGTCRFQFTDTRDTFTRDEAPAFGVWLSGLWLILQSDNGISSIRLAEALGISQPTTWRMGEALRLMPGREQVLDGVGGNDGLYLWAASRGCGSVGPASGWSRSTAPAGADPGASCTSVSMPRPGRSSPRS